MAFDTPSFQAALRLLLSFQLKKGRELKSETHSAKIQGNVFFYDVYQSTDGSRPLGTIVMIHGMARDGNRDARQVALCQSLAYAGFCVISPLFEDIKNREISHRQIDRLCAFLSYLLSQKNLMFSSGLGMIAPSFSVGLMIAASAQPSLCKNISALCSIGGFTDLDTVLDFLLVDERADHYGRAVLFKNFLPGAIESPQDLPQIIDEVLEVGYDEPNMDKIFSYLDAHSSPMAKFLKRLFAEKKFREEQKKKIVAASSESYKFFDLQRYVPHIQGSVYLVHGVEDKIIHHSQSSKLHQSLKQHNIPSRLVITSVLSHADTTLKFSLIKEIWELLLGFSFFFRSIRRPFSIQRKKYVY